jgi:cation diffusion facilitator family transporter
MTTLPPSYTPDERAAHVNRVLAITLALNFAVAFGKIGVGAFTGLLAVSADGVHSLIDGAGNILALAASRIARQPPDADHPYGHRRFETIAALAIGVLLVLAAWEIGSAALERLIAGVSEVPALNGIAFAVMLATLIVNIGVNRYERRAGKRLKSELLLADAAHTGADIGVTISVLISMGLTALGVAGADAVAALVVVVFIGRAAWQVLKGAGGVLVDRAPLSPDAITAAARVAGVERIVRVRSRGTADAATVDVDIEVASTMTVDRAAAVADAIRARLADRLGGIAEVEVHFAPRRAE